MWCFWSSKGGVGCSVVAAAAASLLSRRQPTLLVDAGGGDGAELFGVETPGQGLESWMTCVEPPVDALRRIEVDVSASLSILPWKRAVEVSQSLSTPVDRGRLLAHLLAGDERAVIVDVGRIGTGGSGFSTANKLILVTGARRSTLVSRLCYLATRAAMDGPPVDDVMLIAEPGRALGAGDVAAALDVERVEVIRWDGSVARAADAGLLGQRVPRSLRRALTLPRPETEQALEKVA